MSKPCIKIKLFGNFSIFVDGNAALPQLRQARKTCLFLEYLILKKDRPVPHEELLSMLWSDKESANPATALRTLLHRFRTLADESGYPDLARAVLTTRGSYQWNPNLLCEIDVFEFERLCREAQQTNLSDKERIERLQALLPLYGGPLLANSSEESWVVPRSIYYHDLFMGSVFSLVELLKKQEDFEGVAQVCRRAMDVDMFDERLHLELMMALVKTGKKREALSQFYYTSSLRSDQPGSQPSEELRAVYNKLLAADTEMDADIDRVQSMLESAQGDGADGAFVCQYEVFRDIYLLERRMIERYNSTMFLSLLTLSTTDAQPYDTLVLDRVMKLLLRVSQQNLRHGDTISRYSAMQYVVLLPASTFESAKATMDRVKRAFYEEYPQSSAILSYKLRQLCVSRFDPQGKRIK